MRPVVSARRPYQDEVGTAGPAVRFGRFGETLPGSADVSSAMPRLHKPASRQNLNAPGSCQSNPKS